MKRISLHPGAAKDLDEAATFYETTGSPALAARFVAEFRRVAELVGAHPELGTPRPGKRRTLRFRVFPYAVLYREEADGIVILVVKHDRRRPGFGSTRR